MEGGREVCACASREMSSTCVDMSRHVHYTCM